MWVWRVGLIIFACSLWGAPSGVESLQGLCDLKKVENGLQLGVSDGAILHWKDFSIAKGEHVQFIQPSAQAWVLNKVIGNNRSEIYGRLTSNGQVVLLNPNGILFGKESVVEVGGLIASSLKGVIAEGKITASEGAIALMGNSVQVSGEILSRVGKHTYIRTEENPYGFEVKKMGGRVYLWSEEKTSLAQESFIQGDNVILLSEGVTNFQGKAQVGDIEISGKRGFYHLGDIERTGRLLLDPESDVTISTAFSYNYDGKPTSDFCNISIDKLIEEIEQGPVTITTSYQGEGGAIGSITVKGDVNRTFQSPYPLVFHTEGPHGILIEGSLTNSGPGSIELVAPKATITGQLMGQDLKFFGDLVCSGEVYGKNIAISSKEGGLISGKMITDGGDFAWNTNGTITLRGEWGHLGGGSFQILGARDVLIEEGAHLFASNHTSELSIKGLTGAFSVEKGTVSPGGAPFLISGTSGAVSLECGTIESTAPIHFDVGRHCHLDGGHITSQSEIQLNLGNDLLLLNGSTLSSPSGVRVLAKGDLSIHDTSSISGRGISLNAGEELTLLGQAAILGGSGPLYVSAGKDFHMEGGKTLIRGGQVTLHAGEALDLTDHAKVCSTLGDLSVTAGLSIRLDDQAIMDANGGDLDLIITDGNLHLYGGSTLSSITHGSQIIIGKSLIMENFSHIGSVGENGTTIVVDHQGKSGGIVLGTNASISTGHSPLRIFSAKREFNTINGTLNGYRYSPSPHYLGTDCEQWGANYPSFSFNFDSPFTLFHKEMGLISIGMARVNQADFCRILINYIGPFTAEMQRNLHPYDEFTDKAITFTSEDEPYFIRRPVQNNDRHDISSF